MRHNLGILLLAPWMVLTTACIHPSHTTEISRGRAVEIARAQVSFPPDSIEAIRTTSAGRAVWRITFRGRLSGQPPPLFETVLVEIDRRSGEVVSLARN